MVKRCQYSSPSTFVLLASAKEYRKNVPNKKHMLCIKVYLHGWYSLTKFEGL